MAIPITLRRDSCPHQWGEEEVVKIAVICGEAGEISVVWDNEVWWPEACGCGIQSQE